MRTKMILIAFMAIFSSAMFMTAHAQGFPPRVSINVFGGPPAPYYYPAVPVYPVVPAYPNYGYSQGYCPPNRGYYNQGYYNNGGYNNGWGGGHRGGGHHHGRGRW